MTVRASAHARGEIAHLGFGLDGHAAALRKV